MVKTPVGKWEGNNCHSFATRSCNVGGKMCFCSAGFVPQYCENIFTVIEEHLTSISTA